ncbi:MAG: SDR family oxidoreductase [Acetobacteraceae bacterium]|nr:SDR family oxidoreductase [Acetobacteraceae bacterium]
MSGTPGAARRVALVTGGAKRIGAAICEALAADGWRVAIHSFHSRPDADALAHRIGCDGGAAFVVQANLMERADVAGLIEAVTRETGGIDLLVNNAAAFTYDSVRNVTWESFDTHWRLNVAVPLFLSQAFASAPGTAPDADRLIVNLLDQKLANLNPDFLSYTASKAALASLNHMLAMALAPAIRVNGIAPGLVLRSGKQSVANFERAWRASPLGRNAVPQDIAGAVRFLIATTSMTGSVITIDGGESLGRRGRDVALDPAVSNES